MSWCQWCSKRSFALAHLLVDVGSRIKEHPDALVRPKSEQLLRRSCPGDGTSYWCVPFKSPRVPRLLTPIVSMNQIEMLVRLATRQVVTVGTSETVVRLARNWAQQTAGPGRRQVSSNGPTALQFASIVGIRYLLIIKDKLVSSTRHLDILCTLWIKKVLSQNILNF